jgi:hypothetical protein
MQASDASLHKASEELGRNPFDRFLRFLAAFGIWRGDIGRPPEDRHTPQRMAPRRFVTVDAVSTQRPGGPNDAT